MLVKNGYIKTVSGPDIECGDIRIEHGKIAEIGKDLIPTTGEQVIDATGMFIAPGIVDGHSHVGIYEEGVRGEGGDGNEAIDPITPNMRAIDGIKPHDIGIKEAAAAGVTTAAVGPGSANVIGGTFCVIKMHGKRVDDMVVKNDVGMKCAFGENPKFAYGLKNKAPMTRMGTAALLRETLEKAAEYIKARENAGDDKSKMPKFDAKLEALVPVLKGEIPLRAHAHQADDIYTAIRIAKEFGVKFTIEHCTEGYLIADDLAKENVCAFVGPLMSARSKYELRQITLKTPGILERAGVKFGLTVDAPVMPLKYLITMAGLAVREGLSEDGAWKALTLHPAEILELSDRIGSITVGKDADLAIYTRNPLQYVNAKVVTTIIDGQVVFQAE